MDNIASIIPRNNTENYLEHEDIPQLTEDYPSYTLTVQQRLKIIANLVVDRLLEEQQKERLSQAQKDEED